MALCKYLDGENLCPLSVSDARKLVGKRVRFLTTGDIDYSGRGYYWPREGEVIEVAGRNIAIGGEQEFYYLPNFKELVIV